MIKASFNRAHLARLRSAIEGVAMQTHRQAARLPFRCAVRYQMDLIENIVTQKYSFQKYTDKYEKWKMKTVGHLDFWKLHGDLIKSLTVFKHNVDGLNGWIGGIAPGALNREGKLIKMYASPNERLRPLFENTRGDFVASRWLAEGRQSLNAIKAEWR